MGQRKYDWKDKEHLLKVVSESISIADVLRKLGIAGSQNYSTFNKYKKKFELDTSHFGLNGFDRKGKTKLEDIFSGAVTYNNTHNLKERMFKEGIKERKCELCGQDEIWRGKRMSLIMDHIDGNNKNNTLSNLRIVCPNCDATLDTFKGKNRK